MSIGIENISIGFTREVLIVGMIPIESKRSVVGRLILVVDLELVWESYSWDTHKSVVIGEFSGGKSDGISLMFLSTFCNSRVGILYEIKSIVDSHNIITRILWEGNVWIRLEYGIEIGEIGVIRGRNISCSKITIDYIDTSSLIRSSIVWGYLKIIRSVDFICDIIIVQVGNKSCTRARIKSYSITRSSR